MQSKKNVALKHFHIRLLVVVVPICALSAAYAQSLPGEPCNFKWQDVCYPDQSSAEEAMRAGSEERELLEEMGEDDDRIYYHVPPVPPLPPVSWRGTYYTEYTHPVISPAFATYGEALAFTIEKAGQPSEKYPDRIASDNLIFRQETVEDDLITRHFTHDYPAVPITYVDVTDHVQYRYCFDYSVGVPEAKITMAFHIGYGPEEVTPSVLQPNIVSFVFNNCLQGEGDPYYQIFAFHVFRVFQVRNVRCNPPYTFDGTECVVNLEDEILKGPFFVAEAPPQVCPIPTRANPCDPSNGNKHQVETDYSTTAEGGLSFARYYNSKGPYKSAGRMGVGWRHSYSRSLDERPDKNRLAKFIAPADRSRSYATEEDACLSGWGDLKDSVWGGDLAGATAAYAGGNMCEISLGGKIVAYFLIRDAKASGNFVPAPGIRSLIRPNGSVIQFQLSGIEWVNVLNPALKLEQSGGTWTFTDSDDSKETYDASGRLLAISRRTGQTETLEYDLAAAQGGDDNPATLDRVTGPFGHALIFTYDTSGRLESVDSPDGTTQYGYDGDDNLNLVSYPDLSTRQYVFEKTGLPNLLTGLIDENGDRYSTWDYDDAGRAILSEHAGGKERVQFTYNADGTTTTTMADGSSRTYDFSTQQGQRRVTTVTGDTCASCPDGNIRDRSYDANGFRSGTVDWNDNITSTARDGRGLVTTLVEGAGSSVERTTDTEWHTDYRLPTKIRAPKNVTDLTYDSSGNLLTRIITAGTDTRTWTITYNPSGQPLTIDGPRTDVADNTTLAYYECTTGTECGQLQSVTNALGHVTTFDSYDASGRLLSMTDANGLQTAFTYDARGRLLTTRQIPIAGTVRTTTTSYDLLGQVASLTTPDGQVLTYTYDAAHFLTSVSDNFGNRIDYDYDSMGNRTSEETYDPGNFLKRTLAFTYDLNNRIDTVSSGGFVTDLTFDAVGNLTAETDPRLANTQHNYDALNRLDDTIDALDGIIDYAYDSHDNLTSVSAANGVVTTYAYDDLDNLVEEMSPDRGQITYSYDDAGNRITELDARGKLTSYAYDALNRLVEVTFDDGQTIVYQYDIGTNAIGRLTSITDSTGQTEWQYDNFGAVTQKQQFIGAAVLTTGYSYDDNGRLASMTLPSGKVLTYGYNAYQQASVSIDGQPVLSAATYDPFGPVKGWNWGDGSVHARNYDLRGLMTSHSIASDTRTLEYDAAGNVSNVTDSRQAHLFDYDLLGRLTNSTPNDSSDSEPLFSSAPALLTSIQTMRNEIGAVPGEPSMPWLTVAAKNVTDSSAKVALERSQVNTGSIDVREKIGYLAIEVGSGGSFVDSGGNTISYEAQITPNAIKGWDNGCFTTNFLNIYGSKPVVMASLNSHNAGDGGWLRRCSLGRSALGLTVDEDRFGDTERRHGNAESAGIVAFSAAFDAQFVDNEGSWGMEVAKVTLPRTTAGSAFTRIDFRQTYATRPIVIILPNKNGFSPASVRVRKVRKTGFEVLQVEPAPEDGTHGSMSIHYLAIEPGVHTLPDGTKLKAGKKTTKKQQHGSGVIGSEGWATVNFLSNQVPMGTQSFTYDANGNRTSLTEDGMAYPYDYAAASNRLLSTAGPQAKTFSYDAAGNITGDNIHTYGYDDRGRLTSVDSGLVTYQHNGQGQRVVKNAATQTLFAYDEAGMLVGEYDALGTPIQENVYFRGAPVAVLDGENQYFVHTDHLGTPRAITDGGTVIWRWESDAFGSSVAQEDPDGDSTLFTYNLRFPGQYKDGETGLHYNYFRTYDSSLGRYRESDPIGLDGGLNTYGYVGGNPHLFIDPLGLTEWQGELHVASISLGVKPGNSRIPLPIPMDLTSIRAVFRSPCENGKRMRVELAGEDLDVSSIYPIIYPASFSITLDDRQSTLNGWGLQGDMYISTVGLFYTKGIFRLNGMADEISEGALGVGFFSAEGRMSVVRRPQMEQCSCSE